MNVWNTVTVINFVKITNLGSDAPATVARGVLTCK